MVHMTTTVLFRVNTHTHTMYKDTKYRLHTDCHRKGNTWADQDTSKHKQFVHTAV